MWQGVYVLVTVTVVVLFAGYIAVRLCIRNRAAGGDDALPRCGRCGYTVVGLRGDICPECGSDLAQVGIVRPSDRYKPTRGENAIAWTLLIAILGFIAIGALPDWLDREIPVPIKDTFRIELRDPGSGAYASATVIAESEWRWPDDLSTPSRARLVITERGGKVHTLQIDQRAERIASHARAELSNQQASAETILTWMRSTGIDCDETVLGREAEILDLAIRSRGFEEVWDRVFSLSTSDPIWRELPSGGRIAVMVFRAGSGGGPGSVELIGETGIRGIVAAVVFATWCLGILVIFMGWRRPGRSRTAADRERSSGLEGHRAGKNGFQFASFRGTIPSRRTGK